MKKLFFSLAVMIGLSFCSTHVLAQAVQQYEYATLVSFDNITFIKPDGSFEVSEIEKAPEVKGNYRYYNRDFSVTQAINKKAKEGWEIVSTIGEHKICLRRPVKK